MDKGAQLSRRGSFARFRGLREQGRDFPHGQHRVLGALEDYGVKTPALPATIVGLGGRACPRCRAYDRRVERCVKCPPFDPSRRIQLPRCPTCRAAAPRPRSCRPDCPHPSKAGLAEYSGTSRQTARRAVREAERRRWMLLERRRGRGRPTIYRDPRDPRHQQLTAAQENQAKTRSGERRLLGDILREQEQERRRRRGPP